MTVIVTTKEMSRTQASDWVAERGIERLPKSDERLEYVPPFSYNQHNLERVGKGFKLTSYVITD